MSQFVDECRKEWKRLDVPEAMASEMAADLDADLSEAQADGVSPEEVLGNGLFDPTSFAASWAAARGIINPTPPRLGVIRHRPWAFVVSAAASVAFMLVGLILLAGRSSSSVDLAQVAFRRVLKRPLPGFVVASPRSLIIGSGAAHPVGLLFLLIGLAGLGVTLLIMKPWTDRKARSGFDQNIGMPSYL
jgi:hypothetical protein